MCKSEWRKVETYALGQEPFLMETGGGQSRRKKTTGGTTNFLVKSTAESFSFALLTILQSWLIHNQKLHTVSKARKGIKTCGGGGAVVYACYGNFMIFRVDSLMLKQKESRCASMWRRLLPHQER